MAVRQEIEARLRAALSPHTLEVVDESHLHRGHAGARPEGESHFRVRIVAAAFEGKSRVARQRLVFAALGDLMDNPIHALALKTLTPEEAEA
jgi:BolA protein